MRLVNRWREYREKQGLTLEEVGREIGVTRQQVSAIELGVAHTTSERMERACRLFGCQPGDLYQMVEDEEMKPVAS